MRPIGLLALAAGACVEVRVSVPELCLRAEGVQFELPSASLPEDWGDTPAVIEEELVQDELEGWPVELEADVAFHDGLLRAGPDSDLSFVRAARVSLASLDPARGLPTIDLLAFDRAPGDAQIDVPVAGVAEAVDLGAYLADGGAVFGIALEGDLAEAPEDVVLDAELCLGGTLSYAHQWWPPPASAEVR